MRLLIILALYLILFVFEYALTNVELPCKPVPTQKLNEFSCLVHNIPGDFTGETVLIRPEHPKQTVNVTIERVQLGHLPKSFFQLFPNVKYLSLDRCAINSLQSFESSSSLQWLYLPHNHINEIGEGQLSRCIRVLEMQSNRIRRIHEQAFEVMTELIWLNLAENRIRNLPQYVFSPNMIYINLEGNKITSAEYPFRDLVQLTHLNLSRNKIRSISQDAFRGLVKLVKLDLSRNRIEEVNSKAFDMLEHLEILSLSGNKLIELFMKLPSPHMHSLSVDQNPLYQLIIGTNHQWNGSANLNLYAQNNKHLTQVLLQQGLPVRAVFLQNTNQTNLLAVTGLKQLQELDMSGNDLSRVNFYNLKLVPGLEVLTL